MSNSLSNCCMMDYEIRLTSNNASQPFNCILLILKKKKRSALSGCIFYADLDGDASECLTCITHHFFSVEPKASFWMLECMVSIIWKSQCDRHSLQYVDLMLPTFSVWVHSVMHPEGKGRGFKHRGNLNPIQASIVPKPISVTYEIK